MIKLTTRQKIEAVMAYQDGLTAFYKPYRAYPVR